MTSWADLQPIDKVDSFEKKAFTGFWPCSTNLFFSFRGDKKKEVLMSLIFIMSLGLCRMC